MSQHKTHYDQHAAWDQVADCYQTQYAPEESVIHYGPWAPTEASLNLLGAVDGLRILELGCGGGQCSVAFAEQGAHVAGIDVSPIQLTYAHHRAEESGVVVHFVAANAADLGDFADEDWDLVFATYTLQYVEPIATCLAECWRVLRPGGRLVFALDHPVRDCFVDADDQEMAIYPVRSYFDQRPMQWRFAGTPTPMQNAHYAISTWHDLLTASGFYAKRLVEPQTPTSVLDAMWPVDDPLMSMRNLPQAIIFVSEKVVTHSPG